MFGVGFLIADRIAAQPRRGARPAASARAPRSCTRSPRPSAAAAPACRSDLLLAAAGELLGSADLSEAEIDQLVDAGDLVREEEWIYRAPTAELEAELAERVDELTCSASRERPPARARGATAAAATS